MVSNDLDFKAAVVTKMKYQSERERERDWWKKGEHSKCKTAHPWAPHFHLIPQHPSHFKPFSIHPSITSHPLSSMAFRGTGISPPPLDNKLTAVENGFFQFGCSQSHYIVIAELHDCLPVWMLVQEKSWGTRKWKQRGWCTKRKQGEDSWRKKGRGDVMGTGEKMRHPQRKRQNYRNRWREGWDQKRQRQGYWALQYQSRMTCESSFWTFGAHR